MDGHGKEEAEEETSKIDKAEDEKLNQGTMHTLALHTAAPETSHEIRKLSVLHMVGLTAGGDRDVICTSKHQLCVWPHRHTLWFHLLLLRTVLSSSWGTAGSW